jgi:DDE superfamily endonuclease
MEDVLDLYATPYDPAHPWVCFDEKSKQLVGEIAAPQRVAPGEAARYDYEYVRNGVANLFLVFEPWTGWRHVTVTDHRTKVDFAEQMRALVDVHYPAAETIGVVLDNLNTHSPASLYEAFEPQEARRLLTKLRFTYTPKHGSWLNMAEIELSILEQQCLDRRIPDRETLARETAAWEAERNRRQATVHWCFSVVDARTKLKHLYPSLS